MSALGLSFISGIGKTYITDMLHNTYNLDSLGELPHGLMPHGLYESMKGNYTHPYSSYIYKHEWDDVVGYYGGYPSANYVMLSEKWVTDNTLPKENITNIINQKYPLWRRFSNLRHVDISHCEFTVMEPMHSYFIIGLLIPDDYIPGEELYNYEPVGVSDLKGYYYLP